MSSICAHLFHLTKNFIKPSLFLNNNNEKCKKCITYNKNEKKKKVCLDCNVLIKGSGQRCCSCSRNIIGNKLRLTFGQFIQRANNTHESPYEYPNFDCEYKNFKSILTIICKVHGPFRQTVATHLCGNGNKGCGCPSCGKIAKSNNCKKMFVASEYIKIANSIWNYEYDYSLVVDKPTSGNSNVINIICRKHGEFRIRSAKHIDPKRKQGCPQCSKEARFVPKYSTEEYVAYVNKIHNEQYEYDKTVYLGSKHKIEIYCKRHEGYFWQSAASHKIGKGCPICNRPGKGRSKGERKTALILRKLNILFTEQKTYDNCKLENLLYFDFYLPKHNALVEFDGRQHFMPVEKFGGEKVFVQIQMRDKIKNKYAKDNNIKLIRIPYYEFKNIEAILIRELNLNISAT